MSKPESLSVPELFSRMILRGWCVEAIDSVIMTEIGMGHYVTDNNGEIVLVTPVGNVQFTGAGDVPCQ
jgi:hypothetical protein